MSFFLLLLLLNVIDIEAEYGNLDKISAYLEQLSKPSNYKCALHMPPLDRSVIKSKRLLTSKKCEEDEYHNPFYFKGNVDKDHQLVGPGKLKLIINITDDSHVSTCLNISTHKEKKVASIVGNFRDGTIHGSSKVTFLDGMFIIANFEYGVCHGLYREFDVNGNLITASIARNGVINDVWSVKNSAYIYHSPPSIRSCLSPNEDDTLLNNLIFNKMNKVAIAGLYLDYAEMLYHAYYPQQVIISHKENECFPKLTWKRSENSEMNGSSSSTYSISKNMWISDITFPPLKDKNPSVLLKKFENHWETNGIILVEVKNNNDPPVNEDSKIPFLENITFEDDHYEAVFMGKKLNVTHITGPFDKDKRFHGKTHLKLSNASSAMTALNVNIEQVTCIFNHGIIADGIIRFIFSDTREGWTKIVSNTIHGYFFFLGQVPILPIFQVHTPYVIDRGFNLFHFINGKPRGRFWVTSFVGGMYTGILNNGRISGNEISYTYPDYSTSYIGKFRDKIMIEAYLGDVNKVTFEDGFPVLGFNMSTDEKRPFYYEPPTNISLGAGPEVVDPYDNKHVYLNNSEGLGEGLFAKNNISAGQIVSLYSYYHFYHKDLRSYSDLCIPTNSNITDRMYCNKYALNIKYTGAKTNIWPKYDVQGMFLPTLGGKCNHRFYSPDAIYIDYESPRWGMTGGIIALQDIAKGREIFCDYGYKKSVHLPWYWDLKRKVDQELEREKLRQKNALKKKLAKKKKV